jgi:23S rRNA A2030 N6-methylase RlmJ
MQLEHLGSGVKSFTDREEIVAGYVQRCNPTTRVDWWLRFKDTQAGQCLHDALFDEKNNTRDLAQANVREEVMKCVQRHQVLFEFVSEEADRLVADVVVRVTVNSSQPKVAVAPIRAEDSTYLCGLRPGDRVRLRADLPIVDREGKQQALHAEGEIWQVLPPSTQRGLVWLRTPDGNPHTWDDDSTIYETFEKT